MRQRDVSAKRLAGVPVPEGSLVLWPQGDARRRALWRVLVSTNHKDIGSLYILMAFIGGCVGGVLSMSLGQQLMSPANLLITSFNIWNGVIIAHGLVMIFWFVMPALIGGMGNWFVPLLIGAPDTAFPRLNLLSFWLLALGFVFVLLGLLLQTNMAPVFSFTALYLAAGSALLGAVNFIVTIFNMRMPGLGLHKMPLFCWSLLVASGLVLVVVPVLAAVVTMLRLQLHSQLASLPAESALFGHLFWFFGHPEAYIIMLPAFGVVCQIISTFSKRPIQAYHAVAYAMVAIGVVGFVVWAHRLFFPAAMGHDFGGVALLLAVPGVIPFIAWGLTLYQAQISYKTPMLWALGFIFMFIAGGIMGVVVMLTGNHSAYSLAAHLHYVLSMAAAFAIFGGFYYWVGKVSGRSYPEFWGKLQFWSFFVGVNLTFVPMQLNAYHDWEILSRCGAWVSGFSALVFVYVVFRVLVSAPRLEANYWGEGATTLEWSLPSPVPLHTFQDPPAAG